MSVDVLTLRVVLLQERYVCAHRGSNSTTSATWRTPLGQTSAGDRCERACTLARATSSHAVRASVRGDGGRGGSNVRQPLSSGARLTEKEARCGGGNAQDCEPGYCHELTGRVYHENAYDGRPRRSGWRSAAYADAGRASDTGDGLSCCDTNVLLTRLGCEHSQGRISRS